jgi:hypothetical protein
MTLHLERCGPAVAFTLKAIREEGQRMAKPTQGFTEFGVA